MFGQQGVQAAFAIKSKDNPDVLISFTSFISHSKVYSLQVFEGNIQREKDYQDEYDYDSLVQFGKACQNQEPNITPKNVFGYYSLCCEWDVDDAVLKYASDFLSKNGEKLLINHILFLIEHQQDTSIQKEQLRKNLPKYIDDPMLIQLPFEVLKDCIDFNVYQKDNESFQKVFTFCLKYLDDNQENENCSKIFSTLDTTKISYEDYCQLTGRPHFDRSELPDSTGMALREIKKRTTVIPDTMEKIQNQYKEDLEKMKEREEARKDEEQESKLLRVELEKEKKFVLKIQKQMEGIKESMFPFLKETKKLHDSLMKEKIEMEEFKARVPLYYPDYSNPSSVGWSNRNASDDGWMCVQHGCSNYSNPSYVTAANKKNFIVAGCSSGYTYSSVFFPIRRDQKTNYYASSATSNTSYFIKFKLNSIVGTPDWKNVIMKQWFQNYTAECDGWIYAECGSNGNQGYVQVNGSITIIISQQSSGLQSYSSVFIPISAGDKYIIYHGCYPGVCFFVPSKKNFQVGMPNYDQEQNQHWNTQYTAQESGWIYAQCRSYNCTSQSANNTPGILMVEGNRILISQNNGGGYYDNASVFIPIQKGGKYMAQGGYQEQSISFFPFLQA